MVDQVIHCMKERMSVDKVISYNSAAKMCKGHVISRSNHSVAGALVASDMSRFPRRCGRAYAERTLCNRSSSATQCVIAQKMSSRSQSAASAHAYSMLRGMSVR